MSPPLRPTQEKLAGRGEGWGAQGPPHPRVQVGATPRHSPTSPAQWGLAPGLPVGAPLAKGAGGMGLSPGARPETLGQQTPAAARHTPSPPRAGVPAGQPAGRVGLREGGGDPRARPPRPPLPPGWGAVFPRFLYKHVGVPFSSSASSELRVTSEGRCSGLTWVTWPGFCRIRCVGPAPRGPAVRPGPLPRSAREACDPDEMPSDRTRGWLPPHPPPSGAICRARQGCRQAACPEAPARRASSRSLEEPSGAALRAGGGGRGGGVVWTSVPSEERLPAPH